MLFQLFVFNLLSEMTTNMLLNVPCKDLCFLVSQEFDDSFLFLKCCVCFGLKFEPVISFLLFFFSKHFLAGHGGAYNSSTQEV